MDRLTKEEITSLQTWSNDKANPDDSIHIPDSVGCDDGSEANVSQNALHLRDTKDVFSHFQRLSLQHRQSKQDIIVIERDLKQARQDIAEGRDTVLQFQLSQKELCSMSEELTQRLMTLEKQFHMQGDGNRGKIVDKNFLSRLEALEKSSMEKNRIIQQQNQQISDLMHIVDNLRPLGSKAFGSKHNIRDNRVALSHDSYKEERLEGRVDYLEKRLEELAKQTTALKGHAQQLEMQLQASLASTHNGSFLWRIPEVARRKRDAIEERITSIYSPPFYTGR